MVVVTFVGLIEIFEKQKRLVIFVGIAVKPPTASWDVLAWPIHEQHGC